MSVGQIVLASNIGEEKVQAFDKDHARLKRATELSETELAVCFLGNSGVGKSTLINAIIGGDRGVVPSGGVGPLTAQALVVRHNERAGFEVEYHGAGQLLTDGFRSGADVLRGTGPSGIGAG